MPALKARERVEKVPLEVLKRVVVVDDSATMRRMVMASLRSLGDIAFLEAASGMEAIEELAVKPAQLLILDLNMHGMEVIALVRKHAILQIIPIIVLTTRGDDESRSACLAAGASRYMTKPFIPVELAENARRLLSGHDH